MTTPDGGMKTSEAATQARPVHQVPAGGQGATWVIIGALFGGAVIVYLLLFVLGIGR